MKAATAPPRPLTREELVERYGERYGSRKRIERWLRSQAEKTHRRRAKR